MFWPLLLATWRTPTLLTFKFTKREQFNLGGRAGINGGTGRRR